MPLSIAGRKLSRGLTRCVVGCNGDGLEPAVRRRLIAAVEELGDARTILSSAPVDGRAAREPDGGADVTSPPPLAAAGGWWLRVERGDADPAYLGPFTTREGMVGAALFLAPLVGYARVRQFTNHRGIEPIPEVVREGARAGRVMPGPSRAWRNAVGG